MEASDAIGERVRDAVVDAVECCADARLVMETRSERAFRAPTCGNGIQVGIAARERIEKEPFGTISEKA
jgi:hypothetical protein